VIPDFITLAEADLNRSLRVREMSVRTRAALSTQYLKLPADFISMRNIDLLTDPVTPLEYRSPRKLDEHRRRDKSGQPVFYTIMQNNLEFAPVPEEEYTLEIVYHQRVPALSGTNTSNWLLDKHPDAYLYGALMQSAPYLKSDERIPVWAGRFQQIIEQIRASDEDARYSGSTPAITFKPF
jgi:hypothetical protein